MKLEVKDLHVNVDGKQILKGLNLVVESNEIHAIMGPNGSGKSTLAYVVAGHPKYEVVKGDILIDDQSILDMDASERASLGVFLGFQSPVEVEGVNYFSFLRNIYKIKMKREGKEAVGLREFRERVEKYAEMLELDKSFLRRNLNEKFSGGEKKKSEILQMLVLEPKLAFLDEIDTGLDVDALKVVAKAINYAYEHFEMSIAIITHFPRILNYVVPHKVHVLYDGRVVKEGSKDLAYEIERYGYSKVLGVKVQEE